MFIRFFYLLKANKVPVSLNEWLTLMEALENGFADCNLNRFYTLARAILIKSESYFDIFDQCFLHFFKGATEPSAIDDDINDWLNRTPLEKFFSKEELAQLQALSPEELKKLFEERLKEQTEAHNGGNRWIGTGGTSPFGHGGHHPTGMRVGGQSGNRSAIKIASERKFRNYRHDLTLDIRQIQVALKKLRDLRRFGQPLELDIEGTIDQSCRNGGDIDLIFHAPKKNQTKILLMMDVGGTMDPYAELVSRLFSAAHSSTHFKDFKFFYFHNCVYSRVYQDIERRDPIPVADILNKYNPDYKLIMIGDAWMSPYELYYDNGIIDFHSREPTPGIRWLQRLEDHFDKTVWLNPEPIRYWAADTISAIRNIFPMYPLTLQGLQDAIQKLL